MWQGGVLGYFCRPRMWVAVAWWRNCLSTITRNASVEREPSTTRATRNPWSTESTDIICPPRNLKTWEGHSRENREFFLYFSSIFRVKKKKKINLQLIRCRCPSEFTPRITVDGVCQCNCYENRQNCIKIRRGKGYFSLADRLWVILFRFVTITMLVRIPCVYLQVYTKRRVRDA